jgi:phospholipid/cholesterol/gamma-HCH transport system substrate-binding protein
MMKPRANEALTGVFVLATFLAAAAAIVYLSAPGVIHKHNTYYVFFDNAGGIRAGTQVLLAGRHVGQVVDLESPVPKDRRPEGHEELEARVKVRVDKDARIYNDVSVRLQPLGMLGEMLVDFVRGDETTGVAPSGTEFVGEHVPGLDAAAEQATQRLAELKATIENFNEFGALSGDLKTSAENTRQLTETLKRQPWRLVWKSTKKYPGDRPSEHDSKKDKDKQ